MKQYHTPVMLKEAIEALNIKKEGKYIDCTFGEGGHSLEIYKQLSTNGMLISIDQDQEAIDYGLETYKELKNKNWKLQKGNFSNIQDLTKEHFDSADGILMDLGMSSRQIDKRERGFSYQGDEQELDMRMDKETSVKAYQLLEVLTEKELTKLFQMYGEEKLSRRIAKAIKEDGNIRTVKDLTSLIYKVVPATLLRRDSHHPARRVFQALRIAVNDELNALKVGLDESFKLLNKKGRLVVITFHSLEDRIVKNYFSTVVEEGKGKIFGKATEPDEKEKEENSRARSARLRFIEKI